MKKSILIPITLGVLASAVITGCSTKNKNPSGEKAACIYDIPGGNSVDIKFGTAYSNPEVKVTQDGKNVTYKLEGTVDTSKLGKNEITYSSESCANKEIRTVTVVASLCAYKLTGANPLYVLLNGVYSEPGVEVKDINNKEVEYKTTGSIDISKEGDYELIYQGIGCKNSQKRMVKVKSETTACNYELEGDNPLLITLNGNYVDPGVSVKTVKEGKKIEGEDIKVLGDVVDTKVAKDYKVSYQGKGCSNDSIERTVTVKAPDVVKDCIYTFAENTNPLTILKGATYTDVKPTVKNASGGDINKDKIAKKSSNVDTAVVKDDYEVVYEAEGCPNTGVRTVMVKLPNCAYKFPDGNSINLIVGQDYVPPKVAIEGMANVYATVLKGEVKKDIIGTYPITYGAKDICANTTNLVVNVKKMTKEELKVIKDKMAETILP